MNNSFAITEILISVGITILSLFLSGCTTIDEKLFSLKEFPKGDEAERTFPVSTLKNGTHYVFLQGKTEYPVIIYSYGSREWLRKQRVQNHISSFQKHGYSVIVYEYSGYGISAKGKATVQNVCKDIEAVYQYLTMDKKISPKKIILFGYSVGGGPSCYLASKYPVGGIILVAPFASAVQAVLPFSLPLIDKFPNAENLKHSKAPLLIYHGTNDPKIPYRNSLTVYEKAKGPKTMVSISDMSYIKSTSRYDTDHVKIFEATQNRFWKDLEACFPNAFK